MRIHRIPHTGHFSSHPVVSQGHFSSHPVVSQGHWSNTPPSLRLIISSHNRLAHLPTTSLPLVYHYLSAPSKAQYHAHLSWLSFPNCPGCPATVSCLYLSCPSYPGLAVMFWPSCPLCPVQTGLSGRSVLAVLSRLTCQTYVPLIIPGRPVLSWVISLMSFTCLFVKAVLSSVSCPDCHILPGISGVVLFQFCCPNTLFFPQLSRSYCPLLAVMFWLPCPICLSRLS